MRRLTAAALALVICATRAGAETPAGLVEEGKRLGKAGQLEAALGRFKQASALAPSAEHDCLVALAYRRMDVLPQAHLWLERARARGGEQPPWCVEGLRREVDAALRQGAYAPVDVSVAPAGATIAVSAFAPDEAFQSPHTIWLPLAVHELVASHPGHRTERVTLKIQTPNVYPVRVVLEREGPPAAPQLAVVPPPAPRAPDVVPPAAPGSPAPVRRWPWVAGGAGVAALLVGAFFHAEAIGTKDAAEKLPPGGAFNERADTFDLQRGVAIGSYAIGALAIGTAAWLLWGEPRGGAEADRQAAR